MECDNSSWQCGEPAFVETSSNNEQDHTATKNHKYLQCTFFRQPKSKYMINNCTTQSLGKNSISFHLSDTCTDSENELDESAKSPPCLQAPATSASSLYADTNQISQSVEETVNRPRVTFVPKLYMHSNSIGKSCLKEGSIRTEATNSFKKVGALSRTRSYLKGRQDLKIRKNSIKFSAIGFDRRFEHPLGVGERIFCEQQKKNTNIPSVYGSTERYTESKNNIRNDGKRSADSRVLRNKCLLKSMRKVIRAITKKEAPFEVGLRSVESIKPENKTAEINLAKERAGGRVQVKIKKALTKDSEITKPIFKRAELEKLLNDSMCAAIKKYRTCSGTWSNVIKVELEKTR